MSARTVLVCEAQVPFVHGGAEALVRELVRELRARGHLAELVSVPFKWQPKEEILAHAAAWRMLNLTESNGRPVDVVIASKFPTYFVRHPNKVTWLLHQYRAAYELCGTFYSDFLHTESDVGLRDTLIQLDTRMLRECRAVFTIARTITDRLQKYNALTAPPLYHPPRLATSLHGGPFGDYVLSVGRIESIKRVDLIVRAMTQVDRAVRLVVAGDGTHRTNVEREAEACGVSDRVTFLGTVGDQELIKLYAESLAVVYPPFEEDLGYVTLEAFLARKPVITCSDSGGPTEFVRDGINGFVCEPVPEALAGAVNQLAADRALAASLGEAGYSVACGITWDGVIEQLLGS
jgi:glycosyltransferase involved in cell wall biosynthesis